MRILKTKIELADGRIVIVSADKVAEYVARGAKICEEPVEEVKPAETIDEATDVPIDPKHTEVDDDIIIPE